MPALLGASKALFRLASLALGASLLFVGGLVSAQETAAEAGRYIAIAAGCASCHAAPGSDTMSGGAALKSPFGNIYPSNITSDARTGLGSWTEADFTRALREGVRKGGARLYPAMPYDHYTRMTDADVHALWEYVRGLPAVSRTPPANTLAFPFNVRPGLAVWQGAFLHPGRFEADPSRDATWNRGAYLVDVLGHCGACHTPRNAAQAAEARHPLAGARIEGWYAPDISSNASSVLKSRSIAEVEQLLRTGEVKNTKVIGPMQEVVHDSLRRLTGEDIHAMAVYLKQQPAGAAPLKVASQQLPVSQTGFGKVVFEQQCTGCHQADGRGIPGGAPALAGSAAVNAREPFNVVMAMLEGFDAQGSWGAMASFAHVLSDQEIADVANYVRASWGNQGQRLATPWAVRNLRASADVPAAGERAGVVCPILPAPQMQPALKQGQAALQEAAVDRKKMTVLVGRYLQAQPKASSAQVIETLSAAYCQSVATGGRSEASAGAHMAQFSQEVAETLAEVKGRPSNKNATAQKAAVTTQ